jgi:hypothetical protein
MFTMNMASFGMLKGGGLLSRVPGCGSSDVNSIKEFTCEFSQVALVEAAGIAPASREALAVASTCVADHLSVGLGAPFGKVPFGLSRHQFNSSRNRRLSSSDPALASPAASRGKKRGARPLLLIRQRDGDQQCCWQLKFWSAFYEAC